MSCTSVGFVLTDEKPVFEILSAIRDGLNEFGIIRIDDPIVHWFADFITINFNYCDEYRNMSVFFDCDNDYSDSALGNKVIFSMGTNGHGPEIIRELCLDLSQFGRVFYTPNDCVNDPQEI